MRQDCKGARSLHFFDLPRELREHVYCHAVKMPTELFVGVVPVDAYVPGFDTGFFTSDKKKPFQPSMTRVNRQLRAEALPLFYKVNDFVASLHSRSIGIFDEGDQRAAFLRWCRAIGPKNMLDIRQFHILRFSDAYGRAANLPLWEDFCQHENVLLHQDAKVMLITESKTGVL
jgi:hypothetical protein